MSRREAYVKVDELRSDSLSVKNLEVSVGRIFEARAVNQKEGIAGRIKKHERLG